MNTSNFHRQALAAVAGVVIVMVSVWADVRSELKVTEGARNFIYAGYFTKGG